MSNAAQNWAWQQGGLLSSDKLVLVALADNAWEDGSNAWPSVALLCRKTSLCRRTVQTSLRRLEKSGHIAEQTAADPTLNKPATYRLNLDRESDPVALTRSRSRRTFSAAAVLRVVGVPCRECGSTDRVVLDHVIPLAQGGADDESNLQPLCTPCNTAKGGR